MSTDSEATSSEEEILRPSEEEVETDASETSKKYYFDSINGASVWLAAKYARQGHAVMYFGQGRVGAALSKVIKLISRGRISFSAVDVQVGDYKHLYFDATRISLAFTEEWFEAASIPQVDRLLNCFGQPDRTVAYIKKAVSLRYRKLASYMLLFERLIADSSEDLEETKFVASDSPQTALLLDVYEKLTQSRPSIQMYSSPFPKAGFALKMARYYLYFSQLMVQRKPVRRHERKSYLIAKAAMWPIGSRPSDDFLVDGESIRKDDLLLYYGSRNIKSRVVDAVDAAKEAGYSTVAWDKIPISLQWLFRSSTLKKYFVQPFSQFLSVILSKNGSYMLETASLTINLRREMVGWDIFFERFSIGALFDLGVYEEQVASTMSADFYGTRAFKVQVSEILDELHENIQFLAHHYHFTWGEGVADLWKDKWCVDQIAIVGYIWGSLHQSGIVQREASRTKYGVVGDKKLIVVFDTSVGKDSCVSQNTLGRYYGAISELASGIEDAVIVVKPKNATSPPKEFGLSDEASTPGRKIIWESYLHANTNELIAAADLVIGMALSSTFSEALICGVPAIGYDESGRDWAKVLPHHERFVFDNTTDLIQTATGFLNQGIDSQIWQDVCQGIKWNYGEPDGLAVERIRKYLLERCKKEIPSETEPEEQEAVMSESGVI